MNLRKLLVRNLAPYRKILGLVVVLQMVQTFAGLTDKERFADLDAHTTALGEYLVNRPDLYEVTATKSKGWLSTGTEYSVSFEELVIE